MSLRQPEVKNHPTVARIFEDGYPCLPSRFEQEQHGPMDIIGVNMRLFELLELEGVEVRILNVKDWSGVGAFEYRCPEMTIDRQNGW
ncbi:MAG: hypothetical protein ACNA7J_07865 [Wenzhouxiangella sp.]